jgi:quercetin dioxygenase-like cupin family protein
MDAVKPGIRRTDLRQHDLSAPGREVVQARVQIDPGQLSPRHRHRAKRSSMSWKARSNT